MAQTVHKQNPRALSFKLTLQLIDAFKQAAIFTDKRNDIYEYFLKIIVCKKVGN